MLNEKRVILMTRMASYEEKEGKQNMEVNRYFRGDYATIQVLKSVVCSTVAFGLCLLLYFSCNFDEFMENIYKIDLISFVQNILFYYAVMVVGYGALTYLFSTWHYLKVTKSLRKYYQYLKKLNALYKENRG